jgi:hypothetical protein
MIDPMRRLSPRTFLAGAAVLCVTTVPIVTPVVAAADTPPVQAPCGSLGPPICQYAQLLKAALAPLEPLFAMGIPITDSLGATVHGLQATLEQVIGDPEAVNAQQLAQQVGDLLDQLPLASGPVGTLLSGLGLDGLTSLLTDLQSALAAQAAMDSGAATVAAAGTPTSVATPAGLLPRAAAQTGVAVPNVATGEELVLPDLGLPDVGGIVADSARLASSSLADRTDASAAALPNLDTSDDAAAVAAALALSGALMTGGLLASRARQRRRAVDA